MTRLGLRRESEGEWVERWEREHRWDALGTYNSERRRGIVHTPEYDAEQRLRAGR